MLKVSIAMVAMLTTACVARAGFGIAGPPLPPPPPPVATIHVAARPAVAEVGPSYGGGAAPAAPAAAAPAAGAAPAGGAYAPGEDAHWFQADDYFVGDKKYANEKMQVSVAKMMGSASSGTKGEAQFLHSDGKQAWTAAFYKSHVATKADLRVGATAFCYAPWWGGEAPKDKLASRNHGWTMAAITDNADLYKGRVMVGGESCAIAAVRVLAQ
jgi:hypothetical protein